MKTLKRRDVMEKELAFKEKRSYERVEVPGIKANFKMLNLRSYSTYLEKTPESIENLSLGGVSLKASALFENKSPIAIDLKLDSENYLMRIFGRIAWVKQVENEYLMGVSFSWWNNEEDKKRVREMIVKQKFSD